MDGSKTNPRVKLTSEEVEKLLFESFDEDDLAEILSSDSENDDDFLTTPSIDESVDFFTSNRQPPIEHISKNSFYISTTEEDIQPNDEIEATALIPTNSPAIAQTIGATTRQRRRKYINSLDEALDENNYVLIRPKSSGEIKEYTARLEPAKSKCSGRNIIWKNNPPIAVGRQCAENVINGNVGVRTKFRTVTNAKKAWELFFTADILSIIVENTNIKIQKIRDDFLLATNGKEKANSFYSYMEYVSSSEIFAFIGLIYLRGLLGLSNHKINVLFNDLTGNPIFGATMSKNRFAFLYAHITFDDVASRPDRWLYDRFAAFREIFEIFNRNCCSCIIPDDYLSLDETLYPMRVEIGIKQFNPSKPAKYGILFKSINACRYPYTFTAYPYAGRPRKVDEVDKCKYYVKGTENTVKTLIENLEKYTSLVGRNLTYDRLYTSIPLAEWLLDRNITSVGTLMANRKGIPQEIKMIGERNSNSYEVFWNETGKLVLNSYVVNTKTTGKRNVLLLSTMQPILGTTKNDPKSKPAIYKVYDFTKGGTDIVDQRMSFYSCKAKSRRWTMAGFAYLLDTCRVNSATVVALNKNEDPRKQDSFEHGISLVLQLVRPFIEMRSRYGLSRAVVEKIKTVLCEPQDCFDSSALSLYPHQSSKPRRCSVCTMSVTARRGVKRDSVGKVLSQCQRCGVAVCQRHSFRFCEKCQ